LDTLDPTPVRTFFGEVAEKFQPTTKSATLVTTHILRDRPFFLEALSKVSDVISLTPKPKSIDRATLSWLSHRYSIDHRARSDANDVNDFVNLLNDRIPEGPFIFVDVGGYYAQIVQPINKLLPDRLLGIVEDTENGHKRYASLTKPNLPIISVARSPLKNPEDFLVGQSIVFSAEALLREGGNIMQGRRAAVLGYGKLGRSIASALRERHVETVIFDIDKVRLVEAHSHGFYVASSASEAVKEAGLVFCATGNISLRIEEYEILPNGCYIATATSSDDEIDTKSLKEAFKRRRITDFVSRYDSRAIHRGRHFYLLNHGQAVNFIHGAVVGPFIYLIQAEIVAAVGLLSGAHPSGFPSGQFPHGVSELNGEMRQWIAERWLKAFSSNVSV
jgi:adenosylhomocysteinase